MNLYRSVPFQSYPIGSGQELLRVLTDQRTLVLPQSTVIGMKRCRKFQTLAEHRSQLREYLKLGQDNEEKAERFLTAIAQAGLLINDSDVVERPFPVGTERSEISSCVVATSDRLTQCCATVDSLIDNIQHHSRKLTCRVFDDSRSARNDLELLHQLAKHDTSRTLRYCGRSGKEAYISELGKVGIDPDLARFALIGMSESVLETMGANRNCALLDTVGECILSVDDDVLCRTVPHPNLSSGMRVGCHVFPRDTWFFDSRDKVLSELHWSTLDVVGEHEKMLAAPLQKLLSDPKNGGVEFEDTCDHLIVGLALGAPRIVATFGGIAGDSGGRSGRWVLNCQGQTKANLLNAKETFATALQSREVLGVAPMMTIAHDAFFPGANFGLDNRTTVAPFFPVGRGEDSIFGALTSVISQDSFFGHIPYALFHNAEAGRSYEVESRFRVADLIMCLIPTEPVLPGSSPRQGLQLIGKYLRELSNLGDEEFWRCVLHAARKQQSSRLCSLRHVLSELSEHENYCEEATGGLSDDHILQLVEPERFVPAEFSDSYPADVAKQKTKSLIRSAGELLYTWPDLLTAAAELQRRSITLSKPLCEAIM